MEILANYGGSVEVETMSGEDVVYLTADDGFVYNDVITIKLTLSESQELAGALMLASGVLGDLAAAVETASSLLRIYARGSNAEKFRAAEQTLQQHIQALQGRSE